jgi:pimeloyl-ACP methyl ester carboxylesterase
VRADTRFASADGECAAWHYTAEDDALSGASGRPCIVMAGGFAATRDCGFEGYAERLAQSGIDVLLFDYRNFGDSSGGSRQVIDLRGQRADYRAAIDHAGAIGGVDRARIAVWGHSLAGGHVLRLAAEDHRIAATVAVTPAADARASLAIAIAGNGLMTTTKLMLAGLRDALGATRGRPPRTIPVTGPRGAAAGFTSSYATQLYHETAGPAWRNEVAPRIALTIGQYRPITSCSNISCPVLVQIADEDTMASAEAAAAAAWRARATVRHYPCDHMDMLAGQPWFEPAIEHQIRFLRHALAPEAALTAELAAA